MTTMRRGMVAGISALAMLVPAAAQAAAGDVYVADRGSDDVWKLGPAGGEATSLAQFDVTASPYGLTLGPDGFLYVADEDGFVWRVDRNTGAKSPLATLPGSANPIDVEFDPQGRLLMLDFNDDSISYVDLTTGALTPFAAPASPASFGYNSIAILRDGTVYVSDENQNALYRFTPAGVRSTVAEEDPALARADGLFLTPDERYLYVGSFTRNDYVRYDLQAGGRQILPTSGSPYMTTMALDGRLLYSNADNADLEFARLDGVLSGTFSSDTDLITPRGIVVEPPPCAGRMPTLVGTPSADTLRGSAFADVILTQGGNDTVNGLGGDDIVCGDAGNDVLRGGPGKDMLLGLAGKDTLLGQAGKDKLIGGKGKDKLIGGKGKDKLIGGKGKDKLKGGAGRDVQKQ